mmetsp:Transcript_34053/g.81895  ORF Transcript_34053/g.81895 Transcript_34053/m.81895 type:complete len:237 (+) Transcript_34053:221-931(+)
MTHVISSKSFTNQSALSLTACRSTTPPNPTNASAGGLACASVAPSPTMTIVLYPLRDWICANAFGLPISALVGSVGSKPVYVPSSSLESENNNVFATMLVRGIFKTSATGSIMIRNPPLTNQISTPADWSDFINRSTPGVSWSGCSSNNVRIDCLDGWSKSKRAFNASWNFIPPSMAAFVSAETSSPFPKYSASTSIPSSAMTVESTSKQTASALYKAYIASGIERPINSLFLLLL